MKRKHLLIVLVAALAVTAGCTGLTDDGSSQAEPTETETKTSAVYFSQYNVTCVEHNTFESGGISCHEGYAGNPSVTTNGAVADEGLGGRIAVEERGTLVCFLYNGFEAGDTECLRLNS